VSEGSDDRFLIQAKIEKERDDALLESIPPWRKYLAFNTAIFRFDFS
jgi:hypothetical protein